MKYVIRTNEGTFVNFGKMIKYMEANDITTVEFTDEEVNKQVKKQVSIWDHLKLNQEEI